METEPTRMCALLVDLPDISVLGVDTTGPRVRVRIETTREPGPCGQCGAASESKGRLRVVLVDLPIFGNPAEVEWSKRRRRCSQGCGSWVETDDRIAAGRQTITARAGRWATEQVGRYGRAVSSVATELGCDWHTVNDTVIAFGRLLIDTAERIGRVAALGLDEVLFVRRGPWHRQAWSTTIVDVNTGQLLDVIEGRSATTACAWLANRSQHWRDAIQWAVLDLSGPWRLAFDTMLPDAVQVADPFHVIKLANQRLDEVRRRVQNQTLGHRGHKDDPLYRCRRLLTKADERLDDKGRSKLLGLLDAGDPHGEVRTAWHAKEVLRSAYDIVDPELAAEFVLRLGHDLQDAATGHLRPDVDLLAARTNGAHLMTWCSFHRDDAARAVAAGRALGWSDSWVHQVCESALAFVCMTTGVGLDELTDELFEMVLADIDASVSVTGNHRRVLTGRIRSLRLVCFQLGILDTPPEHPNRRDHVIADHAATIPQPEIRRVVIRYLETCSSTLRPSTIEDRGDNLELFALWLSTSHPSIDRIAQLDRTIIEEFLTWNHTRPSRGRRRPGEPVSIRRQHNAVATLKTFLDDLALWGWPDRPLRPLLWRSDLPRLPDAIPRALTPDADRDLMAAVADLDDVAARCAITILRGTGLRLGELLDLELDCLLDYTSHGTWLRVPVGKLNTERTVPLDNTTLAAFDAWTQHRGPSRPLPQPRTGELVEFLFVIGGRRMGHGRIRRHLDLAATAAGIGHVHPHQLRHTYATTLVNGGMSLEALMAVLGHVTPEMTLRYAHLASPTIRDAYDAAMAKTSTRLRLVARTGHTFVPERIDWLHSEWIKTRVAHGFCSRHKTAGACDYANICEQCDNFVPDPNQRDVLERQLADVIELRNDAAQREWDTEITRHQHVADALQRHLKTIDRNNTQTPLS